MDTLEAYLNAARTGAQPARLGNLSACRKRPNMKRREWWSENCAKSRCETHDAVHLALKHEPFWDPPHFF